MQKIISLRVVPQIAYNHHLLAKHIAQQIGKNEKSIIGFYILKRSIDARNRNVLVNLQMKIFIDEPFQEREIKKIQLKDVSHASRKVVIVGSGPAGLFAAFKLIEKGIKPIILERGKDVKSRRRDLAKLNKEGIINPESNYCFGEGGAGTYSDGKLYTRSNKRGSIDEVLNLFVAFGADEKILYETHPHIGTNKLPQIITAMRQQIIECGGEVFFDKKVINFSVERDKIKSVKTADGNSFEADDFILATGHSARDIFYLLKEKNINIESKPFALGVRIEHPQELINKIQYHCSREETEKFLLPPAPYSLVQQVQERGVFSFCMCPGGVIAAAATNENELVVNGWSPSKRNNPFANSGIVVQVNERDAINYLGDKINANDPLLLVKFQATVEKKCFEAGGGKFVAPAQRMVDFCNNKFSQSLPVNSYIPGVNSMQLNYILPDFVYKNLQQAFKTFDKKMKGYYTNEAIVLATESRTSSPIRIPRDKERLFHEQIKNLYPCGEGAGYAGGIISAAMDGQRVAAAIADKYV